MDTNAYITMHEGFCSNVKKSFPNTGMSLLCVPSNASNIMSAPIALILSIASNNVIILLCCDCEPIDVKFEDMSHLTSSSLNGIVLYAMKGLAAFVHKARLDDTDIVIK